MFWVNVKKSSVNFIMMILKKKEFVFMEKYALNVTKKSVIITIKKVSALKKIAISSMENY